MPNEIENTLNSLGIENFDQKISSLIDMGMSMTINYLPKLLLAIVTLIIGLWIIRRACRVFEKLMEVRKSDPTLKRFLNSLISVLLKALLFISVASMVGIETTSFVAIIGAAGLAVGLALQGSLSNFAGGVLILIFKPYKVGDVVESEGVLGIVKEVQIFNTILNSFDNKRIIIPNSKMSNNTLINYSTEATRRVDFVFGIGYDDDLLKAKQILIDLVAADERVLKSPAYEVFVKELADSSVNFGVRAWVRSGDYWGLYFDLTEKVKLTFDEQGISIPYPQQDVHLHQAQHPVNH